MGQDPETRTPAERFLSRRAGLERDERPQLERSRLQSARTVEGYLMASGPPRWMTRVAEIDRGIARERRRLEEAREALRAACAGDPAAFAARWRAAIAAWRFDPELNELIAQHNEWYPIERRLPLDPRTGDYVRVSGRSHRRPALDAAWALAELPAG
jgi:hypothetical protein